MATGAARSARDPRHDMQWTWFLLVPYALVFVVIVVFVVDTVGFGGPPWFGWWEEGTSPATQPYTAVLGPPAPGGTIARAGIRDGDWIDLREQSRDARFTLFAEPMAKRPLALVIHRGARAFTTRIFASTIWEGDARFKLWSLIPGWTANILLFGCAFLIAIRRALTRDGRMLALILLLEAGQGGTIVVPNAAATVFLTIASITCGLVAFLLLIALSSRFGVRTTWRGVLEGCAYGVLALNAATLIAFSYGLLTLRIDPLRYVPNYPSGIFTDAGLTAALSVALPVSVVIVAAAAVASTVTLERARAAWLLLPLPLALLAANWLGELQAFVQTWAAFQALLMLSSCALLVGALIVTYALLKRRVLDFEFVLSRTIVVAIVSLIVVASFVLLEWMLGTVLVGVSHVTGLLANAGLALVLGLSMNYIHKRVDTAVDAVLFRKRRDDERALLDFSKEAAYVTDSNALLDQSVEKVKRHTDARSGVILVDETGAYRAVRSYGDGAPAAIGENDAAILALRTWHKPLDPHHYATDMRGALALPMLGRGRLLGVLLLGERSGGEAYAPDEVEALSQFAHGVGSALDVLTHNGAADPVLAKLDAIGETLVALPEAIAERLRTSSS
jgi:hypothetical protein